MATPNWPKKSINYKRDGDQIKCIIKTMFEGQEIVVSAVRDTLDKAEKAANTMIQNEVRWSK